MQAIRPSEADLARTVRRQHLAQGSSNRAGQYPGVDRLAARLTLLEAVMRYREQDEQGALECVGQLADCPIAEMSELLGAEPLPQKTTAHNGIRAGKPLAILKTAVQPQSHHRPDGPRLTRNQLTLLQHVAAGASNCQAARRMGVSQNTVKWHLKQIFRRLEVSNRCAALAAARAYGAL